MIGFGMIGCGRIADKHIASLAQCEEAELRAVCDIQHARMQEAEQSYRKQLHGVQSSPITHYADASDLLQDETVQAVIVSTHSALHAQFAIAALEAGKHLVLEKPMALSLQEADDIIRLADAKGLLVQVCHQLRYRPLMQTIKQCIDRGSLGRLHMGVATIRLQRSEDYYQEAKWRGTWDQDGGMLLNQGIHLVDLLQWFLGDAVQVYGRMTKGPMQKQTEDVAAGIVQFASGAIGVIEANTIAQPNNFDNAITLFGDEGTISIGGIRMNEVRRWYCTDGSLPPKEEELQANEHVLMYESFIRAIQGDRRKLISASQGKKALEIIFALYNSVRGGQPVNLPMGSFATHMMKQLEGWS